MRRTTLLGSALAAACIATTTVVAAPAASADPGLPPGLTVVAGGFVQPTHVAFGPGNTLYVADIGTGSVSKVSLATGASRVVASGLGFSPGVDVRGNGNVMATSTLGNAELGRPPARLLRIDGSGHVRVKADTLAWEVANNPDGQGQQTDALSNPYSVLALPGRTLVVDAGANDLLEVRADGAMRTLTAFPTSTAGPCASKPENDPGTFGCDAVPTDVEMGPDGYLYVSGLGAFVEGHIWKVDAHTGEIVQSWGHLPPLTGIAVADDGTIYAASVVADVVLRIGADGVSSAAVPAPTDVEIGHGMVVAASFVGAVLAIDPSAFH